MKNKNQYENNEIRIRKTKNSVPFLVCLHMESRVQIWIGFILNPSAYKSVYLLSHHLFIYNVTWFNWLVKK